MKDQNGLERPKPQPLQIGRFEMRIDAELQALVDNWRAAQPRIPSMADAIRQLVRLGLHALPKRKSFYRHRRFREPGSGYTMELGKWYLLSDSGGGYSAEGFLSADAARAAALGLKDYELEADDVSVPLWLEEQRCWDNNWAACNILFADNLLTFWQYTEPAMLVQQGLPAPT
jgi:hypothetical protein